MSAWLQHRLRLLPATLAMVTSVAGCAPSGSAPTSEPADAHWRLIPRDRVPAVVAREARGVRLAFSRASARVVQRQPAPGSCKSVGQGLFVRPNRRCTPGALNPSVRQADIRRTVCRYGWTRSVRPPESVTEPEKRSSLSAYGDHRPLHDYEYDHLVPLELGGAANSPRNLWPEPGGSPNPKDDVELLLRDEVCEGRVPLAAAQRAIAHDWLAFVKRG